LAFYIFAGKLLFDLRTLLLLFHIHLVGEVIFVDVGDVLDRLPPDGLRRQNFQKNIANRDADVTEFVKFVAKKLLETATNSTNFHK